MNETRKHMYPVGRRDGRRRGGLLSEALSTGSTIRPETRFVFVRECLHKCWTLFIIHSCLCLLFLSFVFSAVQHPKSSTVEYIQTLVLNEISSVLSEIRICFQKVFFFFLGEENFNFISCFFLDYFFKRNLK